MCFQEKFPPPNIGQFDLLPIPDNQTEIYLDNMSCSLLHCKHQYYYTTSPKPFKDYPCFIKRLIIFFKTYQNEIFITLQDLQDYSSHVVLHNLTLWYYMVWAY